MIVFGSPQRGLSKAVGIQTRLAVLSLVCLGTMCLLSPSIRAQGTMFYLTNSTYYENFDYTDVARVGVGNRLMQGWTFTEILADANNTYRTSRGDDALGNTYSYGPLGQYHNERALGTLRSPTLASQFGVQIQNLLGYTITSLNISYTGEQWRVGNRSGPAPDRLDFAYKIGGGTLTDGTWIDVNQLDFNSVVTSGSARMLDGNAVANQNYLTYTITGLSIANGETFWLRWSDFANPFGDDGLAVDDLTVVAPEPSAWTLAGLGLVGWLLRHRLLSRSYASSSRRGTTARLR